MNELLIKCQLKLRHAEAMLFHKQKQKMREKLPCNRDLILSVIVARWVTFSAGAWTPQSYILCILNTSYFITQHQYSFKEKEQNICYIRSSEHMSKSRRHANIQSFERCLETLCLKEVVKPYGDLCEIIQYSITIICIVILWCCVSLPQQQNSRWRVFYSCRAAGMEV